MFSWLQNKWRKSQRKTWKTFYKFINKEKMRTRNWRCRIKILKQGQELGEKTAWWETAISRRNVRESTTVITYHIKEQNSEESHSHKEGDQRDPVYQSQQEKNTISSDFMLSVIRNTYNIVEESLRNPLTIK